LDDHLARMNENKNGKKYHSRFFYSFVVGHIRAYFHLPYHRQTEVGILKDTGKNLLFIQAIRKSVEE